MAQECLVLQVLKMYTFWDNECFCFKGKCLTFTQPFPEYIYAIFVLSKDFQHTTENIWVFVFFVETLKDFPLNNLSAFLQGPKKYRKRPRFGLMKNRNLLFTYPFPLYFLSPFTQLFFFFCLCHFVWLSPFTPEFIPLAECNTKMYVVIYVCKWLHSFLTK